MAEDKSDSILPAIITGTVLLAIVTAPLWIPALSGIKPKYCKCGVELCGSGICPFCGCQY